MLERASLGGGILLKGGQFGGLEVGKKSIYGSNIGCQENTLQGSQCVHWRVLKIIRWIRS